MATLKELKAKLLSETKQSNSFRVSRNKEKDAAKKKAWQKLIDLADKSKEKIRSQIKKAEGLNAKLPTGMTKSIAKQIKVTGLKKADGTLQKGFKYVKGGKIVKTAKAK